MSDQGARDVDDTDADSTEEALAAAIVAMILASDPAGSSEPKSSGAWLPIIDSTVGMLIRAYILRALIAFLSASSARQAEWMDVIEDVVDRVYPEILARVSERVADRVADVAGEYVNPTVVTDVAVGEEPVTAEEVGRRVRVGGELLAREVVTAARESARYELATELGVTRKRWRTRRDGRVRPTHGGLEGNTIPIDQPFITLNGDPIMLPGDPAAPISETAGCRCRLSYILPAKVDR